MFSMYSQKEEKGLVSAAVPSPRPRSDRIKILVT